MFSLDWAYGIFLLPNTHKLQFSHSHFRFCGSFADNLNPDSLITLEGCKIGDDVVNSKVGECFQFMRQGYFCKDPDSDDNNIIINRTVALKDSFAKKV